MLIKKLKELQLKSEFISLGRNCSDDLLDGQICKVTEDAVAMHEYDGDFMYQGFTVFRLDQIENLSWGRRYHNSASQLISRQEKPETPTINSESFNDIVIELGKKYSSLCIYETDDDNFNIGTIEDSDEKWLQARTFGTSSTVSHGYILNKRDEIIRITVNSPYQNKIVELHELETRINE